MSDINKDILDWLEDKLDRDVYYGVLPDGVDFSSGAVSFIRLVSLMDDTYHVSNAQYQFSVRHTDLDAAFELKEKIIELLLKQRQSLADPWLWFVNSELGELYEDDGRLVHLPIIAALRYVRFYP